MKRVTRRVEEKEKEYSCSFEGDHDLGQISGSARCQRTTREKRECDAKAREHKEEVKKERGVRKRKKRGREGEWEGEERKNGKGERRMCSEKITIPKDVCSREMDIEISSMRAPWKFLLILS